MRTGPNPSMTDASDSLSEAPFPLNLPSPFMTGRVCVSLSIKRNGAIDQGDREKVVLGHVEKGILGIVRNATDESVGLGREDTFHHRSLASAAEYIDAAPLEIDFRDSFASEQVAAVELRRHRIPFDTDEEIGVVEFSDRV